MKNRKGFTLIELLVVIVILGLLMAIAIPSITKYITESRKKTLVSTMGNYMSAMVNEVNDLTYTFTETNTVYAVPIECIALERGGNDPFGLWHQANDAYWAYVLVQYDDETSSYTYGYTFKDSAGYGLYPTAQSKLNEQGKQIQTGLDLKKPESGKVTNITVVANWNGFVVDSTTDLVVLKAAKEGEVGDGKTTCTLQQKGDNYAQVEQENEETKVENIPEEELPMLVNLGALNVDGMESIQNIIFETSINIPADAYFSMDLSSTGNGKVMGYVDLNGDLYIQGDGEIYTNYDSSNMFSRFTSVKEIRNIEVLDTSKTTNMSHMFESMRNLRSLNLSGFNTRNVTDMSYMFFETGADYNSFTLDLGNNFDTNKVINMSNMFSGTGYASTVFTLDLGDKFDTSNVIDMSNMFNSTGLKNTAFTLDLGNRFNTSKVTNMSLMFNYTGHDSTVFTLDLGDKFDTSNVTDMSYMFSFTGYKTESFKLDCSTWNVDKVTNYSWFHNGISSKVTPPQWKN